MKRPLRFLPALAALFFLGACAAEAQPAAYGWFSQADREELRLAYGAPRSDDAPLVFSCRPRSGEVTLRQSRPTADARVTLAANGRPTVLAGEAEADPLGGGAVVRARASADAPVLRHLRDTGRVDVVEGRRSVTLSATADERRAIRGFFDGCRAV